MSAILALDAGSSSLKFAAYATNAAGELVPCAGGEQAAPNDPGEAVSSILSQLPAWNCGRLTGVGHRVVFGGRRYVAPVFADAEVLGELERLVPIEPLHLRAELDLVYAAGKHLPGIPQVLCFDTAFHRSAPEIARRTTLPDDIDLLIERYGFHGLSYEYVASQLPERGRAVVAHLGSGASLCALRDRTPLDTTMGFSALGGLMMATRPGDLDPGILLRLLSDGYDEERLSALLYRGCGLLGVSGISGDMRVLIGNSGPSARGAVELFVYQLVKHLGSMIAVLNGIDTLVFTGGIGEHAPPVRSAACASFGHLGLALDERANEGNARVISTSDSRVTVMVVPTDETLMVAHHAQQLLGKVL